MIEKASFDSTTAQNIITAQIKNSKNNDARILAIKSDSKHDEIESTPAQTKKYISVDELV